MASRTLIRLKGSIVPGPQSQSVSSPHSRSMSVCLHPRSSRAHLRTAAAIHHCRQNSNFVKSPFPEIDIPNQLIPEVIWNTVDKFPDSPAMKCGLTGQTYTYSDIQKLSLRLASSLSRAGFRRGETLALVLPNCPDFPIVLLGALEAGLSVSFVNHVYTADEMCHQLKDSDCVCVVTGAAQLGTVLSAIRKVEEATRSKPVRRVVVMDIPSPPSLVPGVSRYSEMISDGVSEARSTSTGGAHDLAFLPYSSGTTGLAKGVCLSHRNIVANTMQIGSTEGSEIYSPAKGQDNVLGILPFYHIYGLVVILINGLKSGGHIITLPKFEQESFVKTLDNEKISLMMLVPPLILFMGGSQKVTPKQLESVRRIYSGAAPLGATDMEKVNSKLTSQNKNIACQAYGMTETSPVVTLPLPPTKNLATVGVPVPNTLGKIISPDTGEALGPNQIGELCFKGPQVMLGYHKNAKATADMIDSDGWLRTGDIGYYEEDKHFYVQERLKELIKVKGFQVPPAELEEVLRTHPLVSDVGVIGVPDPRTGETPVAYIVPQNGKKPTVEQIKEFLSEKVSRHKQVSHVIFTDSIPKSAAGKILRKELKELYKSKDK